VPFVMCAGCGALRWSRLLWGPMCWAVIMVRTVVIVVRTVVIMGRPRVMGMVWAYRACVHDIQDIAYREINGIQNGLPMDVDRNCG
jgi:hypothetical protein